MSMVRHSLTVSVAGLLLAGCTATPATAPAAAAAQESVQEAVQKRPIAVAGAAAEAFFSPGLAVGDFVYVSGQTALDRTGRLPSDLDARMRQAFANVAAIVEGAGLTMAHVVYSQVHLTDMAHYDALDRAWREAFPTASPARAVIGVHKLPQETPVAIDAVAFRDLSGRKGVVPDGFARGLSWTPGVMAGDRLYLSGAFGADPASGKVPDDPAAQVQLALDNMKRILTAAGLDLGHVVFVNPYQTAKASDQMNAIYAKHFEFGNTPARATIRVTSLPGDNTIEFTGVAVRDLAKRRAVRPKNMRPSPTASPCVFAGETYYCSAKGPFTPGPSPVQGVYAATVEAQVRQTMRNLLDGLEEAGLDLADVVETHVYLDDLEDLPRVRRVYAQYFPSTPPTGTLVAQTAPGSRTRENRKPGNEDTYPSLEQISLIAVRQGGARSK